MALNINLAISPSSVVHGGQCDAMYAIMEKVLRTSFADHTILDEMLEPACTQYIIQLTDDQSI